MLRQGIAGPGAWGEAQEGHHQPVVDRPETRRQNVVRSAQRAAATALAAVTCMTLWAGPAVAGERREGGRVISTYQVFSDEELLGQYYGAVDKNDRARADRLLADIHQRLSRKLSNRQTRDRVDDAFHELYRTGLGERKRFDPIHNGRATTLIGFVKMLISSMAITESRAAIRRDEYETKAARPEGFDQDDDEPEEWRAALRAVLGTLTDKQRRLANLQEELGSNTKIGDVIGINRVTVFRQTKKLQEDIKEGMLGQGYGFVPPKPDGRRGVSFFRLPDGTIQLPLRGDHLSRRSHSRRRRRAA